MTAVPEPGTIRVLIADDQRVVREGLSMLVALIDDVQVVGTACDGAEAARLAEAHRPDVVLMDLRMPGVDGIAARPSTAAGSWRAAALGDPSLRQRGGLGRHKRPWVGSYRRSRRRGRVRAARSALKGLAS